MLIEEARHKQLLKNLIDIHKKRAQANINKLFNRRNNAIKFADDYGSMILEAKRNTAEEEPEPEPSKAKTKH